MSLRRKLFFCAVGFAAAVAAALAVWFRLQPELDLERVMPARTLCYASGRDLGREWEQLKESRFWKRLDDLELWNWLSSTGDGKRFAGEQARLEGSLGMPFGEELVMELRSRKHALIEVKEIPTVCLSY